MFEPPAGCWGRVVVDFGSRLLGPSQKTESKERVIPMASDEQLDLWYNQLLTQTVKAGNASLKWEKRKQWLADYMATNAGNYASEKSRRDKVQGDWALQDAMDTWNWHRREANRLAELIQVELAYRAELRVQQAPMLIPGVY